MVGPVMGWETNVVSWYSCATDEEIRTTSDTARNACWSLLQIVINNGSFTGAQMAGMSFVILLARLSSVNSYLSSPQENLPMRNYCSI